MKHWTHEFSSSRGGQAVLICSFALAACCSGQAAGLLLAHPGPRLRTRRDKVTALIPSVIFQVITQCTCVGSRISGRT